MPRGVPNEVRELRALFIKEAGTVWEAVGALLPGAGAGERGKEPPAVIGHFSPMLAAMRDPLTPRVHLAPVTGASAAFLTRGVPHSALSWHKVQGTGQQLLPVSMVPRAGPSLCLLVALRP